MKLNVPTQPTYKYSYYDSLRGADFSRDQTEVAGRRSPDILNLISDNGGNPVKRWGWRAKASIGADRKIEKILITQEDDVPVMYILASYTEYDETTEKEVSGAEIWAYYTKDGTATTQKIASGNFKDMFLFDRNVYAMTEDGMHKMNLSGSTMAEYHIPEVSISRNPDGTGGVALEGVNLLTTQRMFSFLGNDTDKEYSLVPNKLTETEEYKYICADDIKVEAMDADGEFQVLTKDTDYTLSGTTTLKGLNIMKEVQEFNLCDPKITFTAVHKPVVTGQDNVRITFSTFDSTEHEKTETETIYVGQYREARVDLLNTACTKAYGYSASDRMFAVGGINKNRVYYSGIEDPTYWPDNNYFIAGQEGNDIVGLHTYSSYLAIIKGDINTETTVYLAYGSTLNDDTFFAVKPTMGGEGAVAAKSFATLGDDPLFLTRNGIFAITNVYATTDNVLRNRSYFLDKRLIHEDNLSSACAIAWRRYYLCCVNNHCYVLDGRQKATDTNNTTNYSYEAYYWENIPASCFAVFSNELWFGTDDGRLCKFNTDIDDRTAYCDDGVETTGQSGQTILTGGTAIPCKWSTPLDDDGYPQYFKTLSKKGSLLTLLPYDRTSAKATLIADGDREYPLGTFYADIFNWESIEFDRFTFNTNETAQDNFFAKKVKKYKRLKIVIENDAIYEPFGILQITKTYTIGNFSKNRG